MSRQLAARRSIPCASLFLSAAAAVSFVFPSLAARLQYDRGAIAAGEVWRLVSGHWAHYSLDHFAWDFLAFNFLGLACERISRVRFLICVSASALVISLTVWLWLPDMSAYRGLSGVDSALFALLIAELWSEGRRSREPAQVAITMACLGAFLSKIAFEVITGRTVFVNSQEAGIVGVPLAHVIGAAMGLFVGLALRDASAGPNIPATTPCTSARLLSL